MNEELYSKANALAIALESDQTRGLSNEDILAKRKCEIEELAGALSWTVLLSLLPVVLKVGATIITAMKGGKSFFEAIISLNPDVLRSLLSAIVGLFKDDEQTPIKPDGPDVES